VRVRCVVRFRTNLTPSAFLAWYRGCFSGRGKGGTNMTEMEQKIYGIVGRVAKKDPASLKPEQHLTADLGIDSPRALELLCDLEEAFGIEMPEDAVGKIETIGDILKLIETLKAAPAKG
jgi:acyl carrier protein